MSNSMGDAFNRAGYKQQGKPENRVRNERRSGTPEISAFYNEDDLSKKKLNPKWFTETAQKWAEQFYHDKLTSAQIRKFYGDVLTLETRANSQDFQIILPQIKMLKSKAAYAANPNKSGNIPQSFKAFLDGMVDRVNDYQDLKAFKIIFETVVGFFYGEGVKS